MKFVGSAVYVGKKVFKSKDGTRDNIIACLLSGVDMLELFVEDAAHSKVNAMTEMQKVDFVVSYSKNVKGTYMTLSEIAKVS